MEKNMKICIVTGGTTGIGYHLSVGFQKAGFQVYALDVKKHMDLPVGITYIPVDLRNEEEIKKAYEQIINESGSPHVLINNGAISKFKKDINEISVDEFDDVIKVNLRGSFICAKEFIQANKGQDYGRIINIASVRWNQNEAEWEAYGASKGGLVSLTNSLAISLSDVPITVNAISPGWIQTSDYDQLSPGDHSQHPSRRVGTPEDILNACLFLAQENSDFINAHNLIVDGGMHKKLIFQNSNQTW